jgi:septin family protein
MSFYAEDREKLEEKYNEKRKEMSSKIEKLSSEIEILEHAIGEEIASA